MTTNNGTKSFANNLLSTKQTETKVLKVFIKLFVIIYHIFVNNIFISIVIMFNKNELDLKTRKELYLIITNLNVNNDRLKCENFLLKIINK